MKFLESFNINTNLKIGITSLISNITTREGSHKGGWARLLKCQLVNMGFKPEILSNKNSLNEYDVIIFDLGAEFSGTLNMFGGLDEKVFTRLNEIKNFQGSFYSWRHPLPAVSVLSGRRTNASTCEAFKRTEETFLDEVQAKLNTCERFDHAYKTNKLLIGDSHTPSVWTPEFMIERQDGRTLFGSTKINLVSAFVKALGPLDTVQIHMSSIDIRHHVARQSDIQMSVYEMLGRLGHELVDLRNQGYIKNVVLTETMGIEDESRELPKTGYYKGTPFYGDWETRNDAREYFNEKIEEQAYMNRRAGLFSWTVLKLPKYFFDDGGKLKFEVMERPQSVHISPEHYRWDLDNNRNRWTHEEGR